MSSIARRTDSKLVRFYKRATDPTTESGKTLFYAKAVDAVSELFSRSGNGIIQQLTGPGAILPTAYVNLLSLAWVSVTQVSVGAGRARSDDDTFDITLVNPITAAITAAGVNGLDAGAEAASTWYYVWVIGDSTGVNAAATLLSASSTAPVLPAGYDKKRRIGCVRNSAASDFLKFFQKWNGKTRRYWYDEERATLQVLTNGNAIARTAVSCATRIPVTSFNGIFGVDFLAPTVGGAAADQAQFRQTGSGVAAGPIVFRAGQTSTVSIIADAEMPVSAAQSLDYVVSDADDVLNLYVLGFDDEI